jgi:1-acyl-sn-glycerol-3-phosphate acyltransferase
MIPTLRTLLFRLVFYGGSVPIVLAVPLSALFGRRAMIRHARFWSRYQRWTARWTVGVRVRTEGPRPDRPVLYAVKHQAFFEAIDMADALEGPAIILKRELTRIPLWGWATGVYGAIAVDREASAKMLKRMMREGAELTGEGRSILLFPEGTRVKPGERPPLKSGFAGLYKVLRLPVVPIAVDSGRLWPKRGAKRAGVITYRFGEPIPPGLPREEAERRVWEAINALEPSSPASAGEGQARDAPG